MCKFCIFFAEIVKIEECPNDVLIEGTTTEILFGNLRLFKNNICNIVK